ncbi:MAG: MarR family winged helix-turn-helix transcriptional regulator [Bacteroidota bacterium]
MNYPLLHDLIQLSHEFETARSENYTADTNGFRKWLVDNACNNELELDLQWDRKEEGRTAESVINTLVVHLNRYGKSYSKAVIVGSKFASQDDFVYLINLKAHGEMTKMELIKLNKQEKPIGIQVINRLIAKNLVQQEDSQLDKRSKVLKITAIGLLALEESMPKIRKASKIVTGNLTSSEKTQLIALLQKLDNFHAPIYLKNIAPDRLLDVAGSLQA